MISSFEGERERVRVAALKVPEFRLFHRPEGGTLSDDADCKPSRVL